LSAPLRAILDQLVDRKEREPRNDVAFPWLPGIVGRGRAFEILFGGHDFDGELAERYGCVNRAVPDAEFVEFVDAFAERVSRFDLLALCPTQALRQRRFTPGRAAHR
jgi:enoyl-CoA hydratase/carnithine racemase